MCVCSYIDFIVLLCSDFCEWDALRVDTVIFYGTRSDDDDDDDRHDDIHNGIIPKTPNLYNLFSTI